MVEQSISGHNLDNIFKALADETRRDILRRVAAASLSISDLAESYKMSFAAIAKHVGVLERAQLIIKKRSGKQQIITAAPKTIEIAAEHLARYEQLWDARFSALEDLVTK
ncbi:MAG: winged helix-turn-helix transcriptional regulator [Candidatus Kaiserbacteria bacterium]|nr:winged helix-turn-helix transcriptional regulator [Candidatus Kaiserbacteria bacterium]MCB9816876.1 winged helix-turn-helix transcriptional regulator [Candidatus Nomurabacteria bacterium]